MGEERVAPFPGDLEVLGPKRAPDTLLGERRGMHGVMQEPGPVVVPQVMVRVVRVDADSGEAGDGIHDA